MRIGPGGTILSIHEGGIFASENRTYPPEKRVQTGDVIVSVNGEDNFHHCIFDIVGSDQLVMFWEKGPYPDSRILVIAKEAHDP